MTVEILIDMWGNLSFDAQVLSGNTIFCRGHSRRLNSCAWARETRRMASMIEGMLSPHVPIPA